jgi:hypothetical protein
MYTFSQINHTAILIYALLVGLTPLIPIPFLDDWVKGIFLRRMVRQVTSARGQTLGDAEVEALLQEDFWSGCVEGCLYSVLYLLREIFSKIFFWIEWQRAVNLVSVTYYTGFLLDAALQGGYPLQGSPEAAARLYRAIRHARYGANMKVIQGMVRPRVLLNGAWQIIRQSVGQLPKMLAALPGAVWQGIRSTPRLVGEGVQNLPQRIRSSFYLRIQVLLGKEKAPEIRTIERLAHSMQETLLKMDSSPFDALYARLQQELKPATE